MIFRIFDKNGLPQNVNLKLKDNDNIETNKDNDNIETNKNNDNTNKRSKK